MKLTVLLLSLLATSWAFAGSYSLQCASDNNIRIEKGSVEIMERGGEPVSGSYFADSSSRLMGASSIEEFLKEKGTKFFVDKPIYNLQNQPNEVKVLSSKDLKDECGNNGSESRFQLYVSILDEKGNWVRSGDITCEERIFNGHCY